MKIKYYKDTDSLYIDLSERSSVDTREISDGVNLDYDESDILVGIDIDLASRKLDLTRVELGSLPQTTQVLQTVE
ncbi:MAG: DUF2283 domain-containing protein [Verrucomicrobiota bacterium]